MKQAETQDTKGKPNKIKRRSESERLAATYSIESLRKMQLAASAALERATGRAILPARQRLWSIMDAVDKKLTTPKP